jgi:hypothetical protein
VVLAIGLASLALLGCRDAVTQATEATQPLVARDAFGRSRRKADQPSRRESTATGLKLLAGLSDRLL